VRNQCLRLASAELVAFLDADAVPHPDWLLCLHDRLTEEGAAACGGATRTLNSIYDRESTYYGYLYHDFTQELRIGLETNFTRTSYADNSYAENRRVMASLYYRF